MYKNKIGLMISTLALSTSLNADKLPGTDYDPNFFNSGQFVNAVASDVALLVCEDKTNYINHLEIDPKKMLEKNYDNAYVAHVKIILKGKNGKHKIIRKKYTSHVDKKNMGEIFTVTSNLKANIDVYIGKIDNALNYISSTPNPCETARDYAKEYKIIDN